MKKIAGIVLLVLALVVCMNATYTVKENEYGYVTRFSKFVKLDDTPGIGLKTPFLDSVKKVPQYAMMYDIPPSEVLTGDKKTLVVDNFTTWKIDDPLLFMRTVGRVEEMENRIDAIVYSVVKNTLGTMEQSKIINSDNNSIDDINNIITEDVNKQLKSYGVSTIGVEIKRLDLPVDNQNAVFNRMISERKQMAESFRADGKLEASKITNETDKEVSIIISEAEAEAAQLIGEGESEYMKILADAYSSEDRTKYYKFIKELETLKESMEGNKTLILSNDSYIVKILNGLN